jgi:Outer membrane protein beta-barrel domain
MHYLLRKKIITTCIILFCAVSSIHAQREIYRSYRDDLPYYFGLTLGYNTSYLHHTKSANFLASDSIMYVNPVASGGITMGLLATLKLNDHIEFRANPQLIIGGSKYIDYKLKSVKPGEQTEQKQILPSTLVSLPAHFKLNSDRIDNFRLYVLGGVKFDFDLSSNSTSRNADDLVKLNAADFGLEAGLGLNFYLPFVTVSPEIKFSYGITNLHKLDSGLKYSNVLDKLQSRMIVFSIHLED